MRCSFPVALAALLILTAASSADERFPLPAALEPNVAFWTRIYAEVPSDRGLIHDSRHLGVVYETIELPQTLSRRASERRLERRKEHYISILRALARSDRRGLDAEHRRVLALWPPDVASKTLEEAARRVRFQRGLADRFRDGVIRSGQWETHIQQVLQERGLPAELAALPHVESSYNPTAVSHAGAAGLWQFTRSTGKRFLRVDHVLDERFDPHLASVAAARLLAENFDRTGSWPLAITAYNHGAGGMERAVRQVGSRDMGVISERYKARTFGFASRNFYAEFLAALHVERNATAYFGELQPAVAPQRERVVTDAFYTADALAQVFGVDKALLRELNPPLRSSVWRGQKRVPAGYPLLLPKLAGRPPAAELLAAIPAAQRHAKQRRDQRYRVNRGDTLSRIAARFGVSERSLVAANNLRSRHRIRVGQVLKIPDSGVRVASRGRGVKADPNWVGSRYRVQRGETLWSISRRVGVPVSKLAAANRIDRPDQIRVGQELVVP